MKNSLIIGLLCLAIGFGAAWLVKPDRRSEIAANEPTPRKSAPANPTGGSGHPRQEQPAKSLDKPERPRTASAGFVPGEREREVAEQAQNQWTEGLKRRQVAKEEARIKKLVDRLGLTEGQADQLRAYYEKNRVDLTAMMETNEGDWSKAKEFAQKLRGDGLEEELDRILTDDQKEAYAEMKQRDRANQMEARAYKDLAKVQGVLDLSPEQKDQVYDILYDEAGKKLDANQDANALMSIWTEGLGVDIDADELGLSSAIQVQIDKAKTGEEVSDDPNAWMKAVQEGNQKRIDEQVELLAPVLDDAQEAAYRTHLESKGAGLFGGFLGEAALDVEVDVKSSEVQIAPEPDE